VKSGVLKSDVLKSNVSNVQASAGPLLRIAQAAVVVVVADHRRFTPIRPKTPMAGKIRIWRTNGSEYHC
jgi:hypothetical protein